MTFSSISNAGFSPLLEEEIGPLSSLDEQFGQVIALTDLRPLLRRYEWVGNGCPPPAWVWVIHAFIAKSVYQVRTTGALIDALQSRRPCAGFAVGRAWAIFPVSPLSCGR